MRVRLLCWLGLIACCGLPAVHAFEIGEPYIETIADGGALPDANVSALAEDRRGFLWIGTPTGLLRFDGYRFRRFDAEPGRDDGFAGTFVNTLRVASDGRLWIGTVADGLWVFDPVSESFRSFRHDPSQPSSLAHDGIYALAEDRDGGLWVGTLAGLDRLDPRTGEVTHVPPADRAGAPGGARVLALRMDRRGQLWIGGSGGLRRLSADRRHTEPVAVAATADGFVLHNRPVISLVDIADGRLWLGTAQDGAFVFDPGTGRLERAYAGADDSAHSATALLQPDAETLWVGRVGGDGGIDVVDLASGTLRHRFRHDPARRSSLASDDVRALLRDRSGRIWVGGYGAGLQWIDPQIRAVRLIGHSPYRPELLSAPNVSSVLERSNGELWVGTRGNGIDVLDRRRGRVAGHRADPADPRALGSGWVAALAETGDGALWAGGFGLYRFDPASARFAVWRPSGQRAPLSVRRLFVDRRDTLWIGAAPGVWQLPAGGNRLLPVTLADGAMLREDVNAIVEDARGTVWIGADPGLFTVAAGSRTLQPVATQRDDGSAIASPSVVGLLVDHAGGLWMDTDDGLLRLLRHDDDHATFDPVSARLGIGGRAFGANLLEDGTGRIWTTRHVLDPATDTLYPLTRADGIDLGTVWFRSHAKTRDGLLLFGGSKGLQVIDPSHFRPWAFEPPVVIGELRVEGMTRRLGSGESTIVLAPGERRFSVELAALDFTAPDLNRYAYRLHGFDDDWISTDAGQRVASYGNLWPGEYRLQVRGSNRTGAWSRHELAIPVQVLPAFWQTGWFAGCGLLGLGGLLFGGHRWRTRRLTRRARELAHEVARRTRELGRAHTELQQSHDELRGAHARLLETQQQLVLQEKMASLGQLVAGVAHEINTPLGVAVTAASMLTDSTRETRRRFEHGELRRADLSAYLDLAADSSAMVDLNLARAAQLVRSFKQVSVDRGSDDRRQFDLAECLQTLVDSLQPTCRSSGIDFVLAPGEPQRMDSYPGALGQVLTQLTQNALQHAFAGRDHGRLKLAWQAAGPDMVELQIEDDGCGIPPDDLKHVFEPFFTRRRSHGSAGLGLHIGFNLVTVRLGGEIHVQSEPGHGSRFVLRLPRQAPP